MRVRPAAKLTIILAIFAVVIGVGYVLESKGIVQGKPLPTLNSEQPVQAAPQVSQPVAQQEQEPQEQQSVPVTVAPMPSQDQGQNSGMSKLLQTGKR